MTKLNMQLIGVIIFLIALFGVYVKYIQPKPIIEETTEVTNTITDTILVKVKEYIKVKADTIYVDKKAKADNVNIDIAEYRYFPQHDLLSGWVDISYTYSDTTFTIEDRQIIKQITNNVETIRTISKVQKINPFWLRPKIGIGWYGSKTEGIGMASVGIILFDTISINASGLSSGQLGLFAEYIF